jgi:RNA polymerase sigma-70 factor (ECF subfamily)
MGAVLKSSVPNLLLEGARLGADGSLDRQRTDEDLMAAVMAGEVRQLGRLMERHQGALLGIFHRMLAADLMTAEDLVQETFLRVLRQRSFSPGRPFRPWLYTVAANLARDHQRARARRPRVGDEEELRSVADSRPGPEERAECSAEVARVVVALRELPDAYRVPLTLRYFNEMRLSEIGRLLQIPVGTVKSRLAVGTRKLRALLDEPGGRAAR